MEQSKPFDPHAELKSFQNLWVGGYYEGNPLDPAAPSTYEDAGFLSLLYVVYRFCVKPWITGDTRVLEIGPGRGAWTKTMLPAREIWCLDAVSAEKNRFWEHVGEEHRSRIKYIQVDDFSCKALPDDYFDHLFSFGVFCHISWEGQCEYYRNLFPKMKRGAHGMIMFADFDKYNWTVRNIGHIRTHPIRRNPVVGSLMDAVRYLALRIRRGTWLWPELEKGRPNRIRFHHAGVQETCKVLEAAGWKVIESDIGLNLRDPIVHFQKP